MRKLNVIGFILLIIMGSLNGQDALFSHLLRNPMLLNPSLQGMQNEPLSLNIGFREQGGSITDGIPIRTFLAGANFNFKSFQDDRFSFGLNVITDNGGDSHIGKDLVYLNFGYLKKMTGSYSKIGEHYLGIGAHFGGGQHSVAWNKFWFGNQYNREFGFIDQGADSGEVAIDQSANGRSGLYYDINSGIHWYANFSTSLSVFAGLSAFHLNRPNISLFEEGDDRLAMRYSTHAGIRIGLNDIGSLIPQVIYTAQGRSDQFIVGSEYALDNQDLLEVTLKFGAFTRFVNNINTAGVESLILSMDVAYSSFRLAMAYDITVSKLSRFNSRRGAWEFNFGYFISREENIGFKAKKKKFRF